jgi:AcrR family transcriptional regulator
MASLRAAQKAMTRKLLFDTAFGRFQEKGYAATTVDDIAATAGTTRQTFYAHYPSRADLVRELIGELNAHLERISSPAHGSTARALVAVAADGSRAAIARWLRQASGSWETIRPYLTVAFQASAVEPELRHLVDQWLEEGIGDITDGLTEAGRFPSGTRHTRAALAMAQLDFTARNWERWDAPLEDVLDVLADGWHDLLGAR